MDYREDSPEILLDFLSYHETIKAHSQRTVDEYYLDLRNFFRYLKWTRDPALQEQPMESVDIRDVDLTFVGSVTLTEIYAYMSYLSRDRVLHPNSDRSAKGLNPTSRARKLATIRSFYGYLCNKVHRLDRNPVKDIDAPKLKKTLPRYLTLDESISLLESVDGPNRERDLCILTLFLNCGLRISELIGLNLSDVHDDALRGECFRKYKRVEDSYDDHSRFLAERSRYERLFKLNIKDYKGWAKGLQKCGYATDRAYANKLIKVIEDYELYRFDSGKGTKKTSTKKQNLPVFNYQVYRTHGLIYVYAKDNDSFDQIARSMGFKAKQLMKFNEVPEDFPLQAGDIVYLEKKKKKADKPNYDHVVQVGESMHSIAQMYGIQIKSLYKMNKKDKDYIPEEGDVLKLR